MNLVGSLFSWKFVQGFGIFFRWVPWVDVRIIFYYIVFFLLIAGGILLLYVPNFLLSKKQYIPVPFPVDNAFPPAEGSFNFYYGKIRSGKTYNATADILSDLAAGYVVYADWIVDGEATDERRQFLPRFFHAIGIKKELYYIPFDNFHFIHILRFDESACTNPFCKKRPQGSTHHFRSNEDFLKFLSRLTDCKIYLDEAYRYLSSYMATHLPPQLMQDLLACGHYDRCINCISQRTLQVHVVFRSQVNRFYKCEKITPWFLGFKTIFLKSEYQDMRDEDVADDELDEPESVTWYFPRKRIFESYNTKWMRGNLPASQQNKIVAFK